MIQNKAAEEYIRQLRFKYKKVGGCDEEDVLLKMQELSEIYRKYTEDLKDEVEKRVKEQEAQLQKTGREKEDLSVELANLKLRHEEAVAKGKEKLEQKVKEQQEQLLQKGDKEKEELTGELAELKKQLKEAAGQGKELEPKVKEQEEQLKKTADEMERLYAELMQQKSLSQEAEKLGETQKKQADEYRQKIEELEEQLKKTTQQARDAEANLIWEKSRISEASGQEETHQNSLTQAQWRIKELEEQLQASIREKESLSEKIKEETTQKGEPVKPESYTDKIRQLDELLHSVDVAKQEIVLQRSSVDAAHEVEQMRKEAEELRLSNVSLSEEMRQGGTVLLTAVDEMEQLMDTLKEKIGKLSEIHAADRK